MYVSINKYATINPGTAIIDSVTPEREEIGDEDELFLPKLSVALNLYPSFTIRMRVTGSLRDDKDRRQ